MIMQEDFQIFNTGADRLRIKTQLSKKGLTDYNDTNFIELIKS